MDFTSCVECLMNEWIVPDQIIAPKSTYIRWSWIREEARGNEKKVHYFLPYERISEIQICLDPIMAHTRSISAKYGRERRS